MLLQDGPAAYKAMLAAIRGARDHINFETYIFEDDEVGRAFADELIAKQKQGVQVNLIYDSVGSIGTEREFFERIGEAGSAVLEYNPVNPLKAREGWNVNQRDHRKLLVVDGAIAFLGGINISSVYSSRPGSERRFRSPALRVGVSDEQARRQGHALARHAAAARRTGRRGTAEALLPDLGEAEGRTGAAAQLLSRRPRRRATRSCARSAARPTIRSA